MDRKHQGNKMMMDKMCACGSKMMAGSCCMSKDMCACGSGMEAGMCCYKKKEPMMK